MTAYQSELRLNFSNVSSYDSANGEDSFSVGFSDGAIYKEVFSVNNDHTVCVFGDPNNEVGCIPEAPFHVVGNRQKQVVSDTSTADDYGFVTILENTSSAANASILGLKFSNVGSTDLSDTHNYINFDTAQGTVGTIEGNNYGGIRYKTTGADYAEFLPKSNNDEKFSKGEAMLKVASEKVTQLKCAHTFEFLPVDLNNYRDFNTSSVGVFNLVLQFLDLEARRELLQSFYKSLLPGGCIILIEKTISKDPNLQQFYLEQFRQYKQSNGYSLNEILMKEKALDGVLTPLSPDDNKSLLSDVGFNIIDSFFQWYNFTGIVAVKESL